MCEFSLYHVITYVFIVYNGCSVTKHINKYMNVHYMKDGIHSMVIQLNPHDLQRIMNGETKSFMTNDGTHVTLGKVTGQKSEAATR